MGTDPRVDITITRGKQVLDEAQAKCCRNVGRSAAAVSDPEYTGTTRVVPSDQASGVKQLLTEKAAGNARSENPARLLKGLARQEAAGKVTDRLKANGHEGKSVTYDEAQNLAKGDLSPLETLISVDITLSAAKNGAMAGAMSAGRSARPVICLPWPTAIKIWASPPAILPDPP